MHTFYQPYPYEYQWTKDHPLEQVIGEPSRPVLTRNQLRSDGNMCMYALTVSTMEPKNVKEAMTDPAWIESMQEELLQFKRLDVWVLVPPPDNIKPLTLKWLFKNKHDEENMVIQNKTRLVVRGYRQEEGIDFEESFAPVSRMEAIRIFLAYAAYKSLTVFQMDVKTAFLHGTIDPTLFIRRFDDDILVVQVYVDDIIFGSTHPSLQVNQSPCGIFINQSNYVLEILKKYGMESYDPVGTPMKIKDKLDLDQNGSLNSGFELTEFSDADYAGCKDTFKSTSGGAQFLGEKLVSWSSKKQDYFVDETEEFHTIKETIHLKHPDELYICNLFIINYFCHFLDILQNYDPMDDEPMWAADRVVALTPGSAITILETANEFAIKGNHLTLVKGNQFDGRTKTDPHKHIYEFLRICDMFKYRDTENEVVRLMMFPLLLTGEAKTWLDELNEGTIKTWDELRTAFISRFFPPALFDRLLEEI
ncbi:retrovirus-related pol polyprotein from transposon TNT 1-94 [Tanacetum coccineum]